MLNKFTEIREEHPLNDKETLLVGEIAGKQYPDFADGLQEITDTVIVLRGIANQIDMPQKASEAKKFGSTQRKIETKTKQAVRQLELADKCDVAIEKARKQLEEAEAKKAQQLEKAEQLHAEIEELEAEANRIGPDRLQHLSKSYIDNLDSICEFIIGVDEIVTEEGHPSIIETMPFLEPYIEEYTKFLGDEVE